MATCPAGHSSSSDDYCDVCGLPIDPGQQGGGSPAPAGVPPEQAGLRCPHCDALNAPDALFCEACGYDFTTGTPPRSGGPEAPAGAPDPHPAVPAGDPPMPAPEPAGKAGAHQHQPAAQPVSPSPAEADHQDPGRPEDKSPVPDAPVPPPVAAEPWEAPAIPVPAAGAEPTPGNVPAPGAEPAPGGRLLRPSPTTVEWVAEVWIDPDWYATQGSTDALPSPGLPDVVPLRATSSLIGRASVSRNIHPDIDCDPDTGVSRRHAQVSTDGTRWWIEDLESANGTFVGTSAGQLPTMPIGRGRVEFAPDQRLYLGGWTRLVIRRATEDEQQAFAG